MSRATRNSAGIPTATTSITVRVPLAIRRRGGRTMIMAPDGSVIPASPRSANSHADPALVKALARAHRWHRMLNDGRYASISDIARAEKIDRGYVGAILRLTLLAPEIVEAIMDGRQVAGLGLPALMRPFPVDWDEQRVSHCPKSDAGRDCCSGSKAVAGVFRRL